MGSGQSPTWSEHYGLNVGFWYQMGWWKRLNPRLVGKEYTQQLGVDYNKTWAGVMRLESVWMTAAIAAKLDLKLWQINFVGAYLSSLTKEEIYMKQPEVFIEAGYKDSVCKLIYTIYRTMQGVSGDTLFHLASLTPPTSAPTFPSTLSLTSLHTADSLDKLSWYNSDTSMLPAHSNFTTWQLTPFSFHFSYLIYCKYISVTTLLSPMTLQS